MEERLKSFLNMEGITASQFAARMGVQRAGISHLLSGRNKPSYDFLVKMLSEYPALNPEWLLMGAGKPYKGDKTPQIAQIPTEPNLFSMEEPYSNDLDNHTQSIEDKHYQKEEIASQPIETIRVAMPTVEVKELPITPNTPKSTAGKLKKIILLYENGTWEER